MIRLSDGAQAQRRCGGGTAISTGDGSAVLLDADEVSALTAWLSAAPRSRKLHCNELVRNAVSPAKARLVRFPA